MDNREIEIILDKFFSGEMNEKNETEFFELLKENDELRKAYELEKRILDNALLLNDRAFEQSIKNTHNEYINKIDKPKRMTPRILLSIAASLIIVAAAYFVFTSGPSQDAIGQKKQYMAYIDNYETTSLGKYSLRGSGSEAKTLKDTLALALHESTNGSMEKAMTLLKELIIRHPSNEEVQLYLAIQHYKSANYKPAMRLLNELVRSSDIEIKEEAEMALAMASSSLNDENQMSIKWLRKIAQTPNHRHRDMAEAQLNFFE